MKEIVGSKNDSLKGKLIVLGICGSVAAVKSFELARELIRCGAEVKVVLSKAACELVGEQLMEFATGKKVITQISGQVEHVKFFGEHGKADLLLIAPATANTISKIAMGIDDTPITTFATVAIGSNKPVLVAPAMHKPMFDHPIVTENLAKLQKMGRVKIISPVTNEGKAKLNSVESIVFEVQNALCKKNFNKKKVLVVTGTTAEEIDPIRIISTNASGKTGEEIAKEVFLRGSEVTLIHNKNFSLSQIKLIKYKTAEELYEKTLKELEFGYDFFFCPAAIGDFEVKRNSNKLCSNKKISLDFFPRKKLLEEIRKKFPSLFITGFKAQTNVSKTELEKSCQDFLKKNGLQMVVGTDAQKNPFGSEFSEVVIASSKKTVFVKGKKDFIAKKVVEETEKIANL